MFPIESCFLFVWISFAFNSIVTFLCEYFESVVNSFALQALETIFPQPVCVCVVLILSLVDDWLSGEGCDKISTFWPAIWKSPFSESQLPNPKQRTHCCYLNHFYHTKYVSLFQQVGGFLSVLSVLTLDSAILFCIRLSQLVDCVRWICFPFSTEIPKQKFNSTDLYPQKTNKTIFCSNFSECCCFCSRSKWMTQWQSLNKKFTETEILFAVIVRTHRERAPHR